MEMWLFMVEGVEVSPLSLRHNTNSYIHIDQCFYLPERLWEAESCRLVTVGSAPIRTLLTLEDSVWASCANHVTVIHGASLHTQVCLLSSSDLPFLCCKELKE